jgi:hypothetical protein
MRSAPLDITAELAHPLRYGIAADLCKSGGGSALLGITFKLAPANRLLAGVFESSISALRE